MRGGLQLTIVLVLLLWKCKTVTPIRCNRTPEEVIAPKSPADNRFHIHISGNPQNYVPGEIYIVSLRGSHNQQVPEKFTGFMLVVEALSPHRVMSARNLDTQPVGSFQLYGPSYALTKFSERCPNMLTHSSLMPKAEVQVLWTAPTPGSGCIIFRQRQRSAGKLQILDRRSANRFGYYFPFTKATVVEHRDIWYQDDGPLSKSLCEDVQENFDEQPSVIDECCACDEAKYEVTFEGLWSRHAHPKDFPSNSWLTRFGDIIGASHDVEYRFWDYGGTASEGLRQVAELGVTRMLELEFKAQSHKIRTIIKAQGISYPNVTGRTYAVFRVDRTHHLMSLVSSIDPSPDWIVGVSALELCLRNCSWVESKSLNLYPWDAGTDSGVTYISPDLPTFPREHIRRISSSFPNDLRSPFYDSTGAEMKPLARLSLTRQRLYLKSCSENNEETVEETEDTETSTYLPTQLLHIESRSSTLNRDVCSDGVDCETGQFISVTGPIQDCKVSNWSAWSNCSCDTGYKEKSRYIQVHAINGGKPCPKQLFRQKKCRGRYCGRGNGERNGDNPSQDECVYTDWTTWTGCSATCGQNSLQQRYRSVEASNGGVCNNRVETRACHVFPCTS